MALKAPDSKEILRALKMCTGSEVKGRVEEKPKAPVLGAPPKGTYVSLLLGDDGVPAAAIVADLTAAVSLGGALVTLPVGVLKEQLKAGTASDVVVDGLSEVFNMIAGTLNRVAGNAHVRAGVAKLLVPVKAGTDSAWLLTPASRTDYICTFAIGDGRLMLVLR